MRVRVALCGAGRSQAVLTKDCDRRRRWSVWHHGTLEVNHIYSIHHGLIKGYDQYTNNEEEVNMRSQRTSDSNDSSIDNCVCICYCYVHTIATLVDTYTYDKGRCIEDKVVRCHHVKFIVKGVYNADYEALKQR